MHTVPLIWELMRRAGIEIRYPDLWTPRSQREGDLCLMDTFRSLSDLRLRKVNVASLHLQLLYVSDITSADGKHIVSEHKIEKGIGLGRVTKLNWPVQPSPGRASWRE